VQSQINRVTYDEPILTSALARKVCDYKQQYTQYGGVRPFGIALLIAGMDPDGPKLYETDPSGALFGYKATSIGSGKEAVMEMLEEEWKDGMKKDDAIALGLRALQKANEEPLNPVSVEIGLVQKGKNFRKYTYKEVEKLIGKVLGAQVKGD
jgi:proteasome alpha subunit